MDAALAYTDDGRVVFPVCDKTPRVKWGRLDQLDASARAAWVRQWWAAWPDASIGMRTGNGLVVIDVDPKHGGVPDPSWPATRIVATPSGGTHHYFASAKPVPNSVGKLAPGVDVRGERGYVVVPPSPGYTWANDEPIAELPALVYREVERSSSGGWSGARFEFQDAVPEGGRNSYITSAAGWLYRNGYGRDDVEDFLLEHNGCVCDPPLDDDTVIQIAGSIARYSR